MIDQVKQRSNNSLGFYLRYQDLCARYGTCPVKFSRSYIIDGELDVNADRIQFEDWKPLLEVLQHDRTLRSIGIRSFAKSSFSDEVCDSRKTLQSHHTVVLSTEVVSNMCTSLAQTLKTSGALSSLTLQKIPIKASHVQVLKEAIAASKNLQHLSLQQCPIGDAGVNEICSALKNVTRLEVLNFSECNLTWKAVKHICDIIQYYGLIHRSDTWHASLRHENPQINEETGLRTLILNGNPGIGDRGTITLAEALADDLWLKELSLRQCGITDEGAHTLMKLLTHKTKAVINIRGNPLQDKELLRRINAARDKINGTQADDIQEKTSHHRNIRSYSINAPVCSRRTSSSVITTLKEPEMKTAESDQARFASRKGRTNDRFSSTPTKALKTEEQLNTYKRLLEEEKAAHKETNKKLNKLSAENEALTAALNKNSIVASSVDNMLLTQVEDTFLKLREFLRVLKTADLESFLGPTNVKHTLLREEDSADHDVQSSTHTASFRVKESSDVTIAATGQTELTPSNKLHVRTKTVQWTALQKHQADAQHRPPNSKFYSDSPSPDHVARITYNNGNWVDDEKSHKQLASVSGLSGHGYASTKTVKVADKLVPTHYFENLSSQPTNVHLETKTADRNMAGQQPRSTTDAEHLEGGIIFSNRASGSGASDSSNSRQFQIQQKQSERSSSASLTDIVSEDEF